MPRMGQDFKQKETRPSHKKNNPQDDESKLCIGKKSSNDINGVISIPKEALKNLPPPFANLERRKSSFASKGLNVKDLVALSVAHTINTSHCVVFTNKIYNFTAKEDMDPLLDKSYAEELKTKCKPGESGNKIVEMDPGSLRSSDNN